MNLFKKEREIHNGPSRSSLRWLLGMWVVLGMFACKAPKNITYFRDIPDSVRFAEVNQTIYKTPEIQVDDILQVTIQTLDPTATTMLNQQGQSVPGTPPSVSTAPAPAINGYLVDKDGNISLPLIGKLQVKGKSTDAVRDEIQAKAAAYYKDPVVNVRFANFKVTVLGEVAKPSSYIMPNEKVSLLDALGMAGDLTIFGKRENVLLIRDNDGKKEFVRFDLNKSNLFTSPYFYLHQGDVVYVEPNKNKVASTDMQQVKRISIMASVLSLLIVVASRINF
ncbi:polysaccharide biosynthesis/export family protein [Chitinophaga sp. Hz27]|uniref:polysaccharide biosynthesis/export family protein n=1 Tax=Chitinophaga sp. Hz27 TaxID=3347169 RepID=UPI0035E082EC